MFIDRTVYEMFQVGGTDFYIHKYIGPVDPSDPNKALGETTIQDVLFMENRDRRYDHDIFRLRGHYTIQDNDINLSQFGIFLQNDTIYATIHINNSIDTVGRKLMTGDVIELPHLKDAFTLNEVSESIKRFYVIEDIARAAEGFSPTWFPHLYRLKLNPIVDSQEFKDIFEKPLDEDRYAGPWDENRTYVQGQIVKGDGKFYEVIAEVSGVRPPSSDYFVEVGPETIQDISSQSDLFQLINDAIILEAERDALLSGYTTAQFYTIARDEYGNPAILSVDTTDYDASSSTDTSRITPETLRSGYCGYLLGDGLPINGGPFGFGVIFPESAAKDDYFLRTDYLPNKLFRYNGTKWEFIESSVRMTMTNTDDRQTLKTGFINNTRKTYVGPIGTDAIRNADAYVPEIGSITASYDYVNKTVVTTVPWNSGYGIKALVKDYELEVSELDMNGFVAFKINNLLIDGDIIVYTVYKEKIDQRQSLSKALRPSADF